MNPLHTVVGDGPSRIFHLPAFVPRQQIRLQAIASSSPAPAPLNRAAILTGLLPHTRKTRERHTVIQRPRQQTAAEQHPHQQTAEQRSNQQVTSKQNKAPATLHLQKACLSRAIELLNNDFKDKQRLSAQNTGFIPAKPDVQVRIAKECFNKLHNRNPDTGAKEWKGTLPNKTYV